MQQQFRKLINNMLPRSICYALVWVSGLWCVDAGVSPTDVSLVARNAPNMTSADTLRAIGRALTRASLSKRGELFKNSTTVEKSWSNATLLSLYVPYRLSAGRELLADTETLL